VKRKLISILIGSLLCLAIVIQLVPAPPAEAAEVTLTILNPKGNVEQVEIPPLAERVDTLDGKKIGYWFYTKDESAGINARDSLLNILRQMYPTAQLIRAHGKGGVANQETTAIYERTARESDISIFGVAN